MNDYLDMIDVMSFGISLSETQCSEIMNLFNRALDVVDSENCDNFRLSINHLQDFEYKVSIIESMNINRYDKEVILKDGTIVNYGFDY